MKAGSKIQGVNKIWGMFLWTLKRAGLFYLFLFGLSGVLINYSSIDFGVKIRLIDKIMPESFHYLVGLSAQNKAAQLRLLDPYVKFYEKIVQYFPDQADAWGTLGFCYYHQGRSDQAERAYQLAIKKGPGNFWFYYNLGLIHLKRGELAQAQSYFQQASNKNPNETMKFVNESKVVYRSVILGDPQMGKEFANRLSIGYTNSRTLYQLTTKILSATPGIQAPEALKVLKAKYNVDPSQLGLYLF